MMSVLSVLARNTGLKSVSFESESGNTNATSATDLTDIAYHCKENVELEVWAVVSEGHVAHTSLETLYLPGNVDSHPKV
jgi:hypothetical protein